MLFINPAFFGFMSQPELDVHPVDRGCFDSGVSIQIRSALLKQISRLYSTYLAIVHMANRFCIIQNEHPLNKINQMCSRSALLISPQDWTTDAHLFVCMADPWHGTFCSIDSLLAACCTARLCVHHCSRLG